MKYEIELNGRTYAVEVEYAAPMNMDEYNRFAPAPAASPAATPAPAAPAAQSAPVSVAGEAIVAPMPGNILKVNVQVGDTVSAGTVLCILEAMKMENEIMAPHAGTVKQVAVSKGATVDTGAILMVLG